MSDADKAVACFKEGFSCSQAVFSTFAPELGLERDLALKIAGSFGGGMGRMAETCGAVTGAYMALGLKHSASVVDPASKGENYAKVREFARMFKEKNGSTVCFELLGCDISTEEGMKEFKEKDLINQLCANFVRDAAVILEEIL